MLSASYEYAGGLESPRLITRFLQPEDAVIWSDFFRDPRATGLFPPFEQESPEAIADFWIGKQIERYQQKRFGLQGLIDKSSGLLIGQCGLLSQEVDGVTELEVGYHILPVHWGKGYAPEAARLFMDYARSGKMADSLISIIDIRNNKSQRVADKNGLKKEKQTRWRDLDVFIYRYLLAD